MGTLPLTELGTREIKRWQPQDHTSIYTTPFLGTGGPGTAQEVHTGESMSFKEFMLLAKDFFFMQRVGSQYDLSLMFRAAAKADRTKKNIEFDEFQHVLVRCAMDYANIPEDSSAEGELSVPVVRCSSTCRRACDDLGFD